ncbi:hypothetical protein [Flavobacterium sp. LS1P3]|uniref:hypothetical protein n=1 Tax=Flavobacterium sp. LS1P3 TaxID=3401720 RepID=UPI003AAFC83B
MATIFGLVLGLAETNFSRILKNNFQGKLRDEIVITTNVGYTMRNGPFGNCGSQNIYYRV